VQALVLVGGEGTRLRPLTATVPKPVVPLVDRPFIAYMIEWLAGHGVEEVVLACGFLPDAVRDVLGDGEPGGPRLEYLAEPEPRGTAGAIKFAEDRLGDRFLVLNGDVLADLDLTALVSAHEERRALATLALHRVGDATGYGLVECGEDGEIREFREKPDAGAAAQGGHINAGVYVIERALLDRIPAGPAVSIEREVFPRVVGEGLYGLPLPGYWMDIGTPDRYLQASWDILEGRVRTQVEPRDGAVFVAPGAAIDPAAEVGPRAVVSERCEIGAGARVEASVLLRGCRVGEAATVAGSILAPGVEVAPGAAVRGSVVGEGERVRGS
jgi:mannose-1-phosphate guanylyltransferase